MAACDVAQAADLQGLASALACAVTDSLATELHVDFTVRLALVPQAHTPAAAGLGANSGGGGAAAAQYGFMLTEQPAAAGTPQPDALLAPGRGTNAPGGGGPPSRNAPRFSLNQNAIDRCGRVSVGRVLAARRVFRREHRDVEHAGCVCAAAWVDVCVAEVWVLRCAQMAAAYLTVARPCDLMCLCPFLLPESSKVQLVALLTQSRAKPLAKPRAKPPGARFRVMGITGRPSGAASGHWDTGGGGGGSFLSGANVGGGGHMSGMHSFQLPAAWGAGRGGVAEAPPRLWKVRSAAGAGAPSIICLELEPRVLPAP